MKKIIAPAILVKSRKDLVKTLRRIKGKVQRAQVDIMDGKFVPNKTIQANALKGIKTTTKLEIQLMVHNPYAYSAKLLEVTKPYMIIFHIETLFTAKKVKELISALKNAKVKVGIALNPRTTAQKVKPYLRMVDLLLVMTVQPGFSGQKFIPSTLRKIRQLRKWHKRIDIEVDGGVNQTTLVLAKKAGANVFVVNKALFTGSFSKNLQNLKHLIKR